MFLFVCMRVVMGMNAIVIVFQMHGLSSRFSFPNKKRGVFFPKKRRVFVLGLDWVERINRWLYCIQTISSISRGL